MSTTVHKHKMVITHPALSLTYGHHGTEEGGYMCTCIYVYLFFMAIMKIREMCMYVRQVLNGVSNGIQGMFHVFMHLCVCMSLCMSLSIV